MTERRELTIGEESPSFDIDVALNTKNFPEFLAKYAEHHHLDHTEIASNQVEAQTAHESFEKSAKITVELQKILKENFKNEVGVSISEDDLEPVRQHVESQSIESPENISKILGAVERFQALPKKIEALEKEFQQKVVAQEIEGGPDFLNRKLMLEAAQKKPAFARVRSLFEKNPDRKRELKDQIRGHREAKRMGLKKGEDVEGALRQLQNLEEIAELEKQSKELFSVSRMEIFEELGPVKDVIQEVKKRAVTRLEEARQGAQSLKEMEEVYESYKKLEKTGESGVDWLEEADGGLDTYMELQVEEWATKEIGRAVDDFSTEGKGALTKLEKTLAPFLSKESLAGKNDTETREFVTDALERIMGELSGEDGNIKKILIGRILTKAWS